MQEWHWEWTVRLSLTNKQSLWTTGRKCIHLKSIKDDHAALSSQPPFLFSTYSNMQVIYIYFPPHEYGEYFITGNGVGIFHLSIPVKINTVHTWLNALLLRSLCSQAFFALSADVWPQYWRGGWLNLFEPNAIKQLGLAPPQNRAERRECFPPPLLRFYASPAPD